MNSIDTDIRIIERDEYPPLLRGLKGIPKKLYVRGTLPPDTCKFLTIVGSRRYTAYGRAVCEKLIPALRGLPVVIVSGLAFGIDSLAHELALKSGLRTIAIPGSGLDDRVIAPTEHLGLAHDILRHGGALLSPFPPMTEAAYWTFPNRNAVMAAISQATLVIEAEYESGTLITATEAANRSRDVLTVPGSIFSSQSGGPFYLLKNGAIPITRPEDLLKALGYDADIADRRPIDYSTLSADEILVVDTLVEPMPRDALIEKLGIDAARASAVLSLLELKGVIEEKLGEMRRV